MSLKIAGKMAQRSDEGTDMFPKIARKRTGNSIPNRFVYCMLQRSLRNRFVDLVVVGMFQNLTKSDVNF